jgi:NADH-quinone oxidoreductase subunit D
MEPLDQDIEETELELPTEPMRMNMGPAHPAMHGTVRMVLELSGETVRDVDVQIGYLHRGFEKMCERGTWTQVYPYVDRLNYVSPMINNVGFSLAVEKMLGITCTERCSYYRVILSELARIADHLTCNGAMAMELGAFTPFLWFVKARDYLWDVFEEETGARLTHSFGRVGGMANEPTKDFKDHVRRALKGVIKIVEEGEALILQNRIFIDRLEGVGVMSPELALAYGWTGPCLRSTGVAYDVRKANPYLVYDRFDFDIPVGTTGDNYDRYMVRLEEIRQSIRICEQALDQMPDHGPINVDDPRVVLPPKSEVYTTIEATIQHFKIVMEGIKVPAGEAYAYTEGGNGELGFYMVSDGSGTPYRIRIRPPCFAIVSGMKPIIEGGMIADIIPTFGSMNMIGGECDHLTRDSLGFRRTFSAFLSHWSCLSESHALHQARRPRDPFRSGRHHHQGGAPSGDRHSPLLLAPGAQRRGQLPHVPRRDPARGRSARDAFGRPEVGREEREVRHGQQAEAAACLPVSVHGGHGGEERFFAARGRRAESRARAAAPQPPGRLPHLRPGGRVPFAGLLARARPLPEADEGRDHPQAQGRLVRSDHRVRRRALHRLHALRAFRRRNREGSRPRQARTR